MAENGPKSTEIGEESNEVKATDLAIEKGPTVDEEPDFDDLDGTYLQHA